MDIIAEKIREPVVIGAAKISRIYMKGIYGQQNHSGSSTLSLSLSYSRNRQPLNEMDDLTTHRQTTVFFSPFISCSMHTFSFYGRPLLVFSARFFFFFFFLVVVFDPKEFPTD